MSGAPSEAEIQAQWAAAVDILETARAHIDGTMAGGGGKFDTLLQLLEGEYTPSDVANAVAGVRAAYASIIDPGSALNFLSPIIFEYGKILSAGSGADGFGSGYRDLQSLFKALYEWCVASSPQVTVETRNITYNATGPTVAGTGNGTLTRVTVDENGFNLEACHVERKTFRCRNDQNSGANEHAEVFEHLGAEASRDSLLRSSFGSGELSRAFVTSRNAGSGSGGSLLQNSSFSSYTATATDARFAGWAQTYAGGSVDAEVTQDTTNYYRSHPGSQTDGSLKITAASGGTTTLKQTLANMRIQRVDPNVPYFLRVMLNKTVGTASGGSVNLRLGSQTATVTIAALAANWAELIIPADENCWFANFNEDPFDVEIEWASQTSGYLLIDDILFAPYDLIDGTYWTIRTAESVVAPAHPVSWLVDDTITVTDTGGAPATGKIQWWCFVSGLGYLPSDASPTFADP
jgi:hypothetical protein